MRYSKEAYVLQVLSNSYKVAEFYIKLEYRELILQPHIYVLQKSKVANS